MPLVACTPPGLPRRDARGPHRRTAERRQKQHGERGMPPPVRLEDFLGVWRIDRRIEDRLLGRAGRFLGEARFGPAGVGLLYDETGVLQFPGEAPLQAERRYLWRPAPGGIAVMFEDGRPFHSVDPAAHRPRATHFCDPDTYEVQYDFAAWPTWQVLWRVTGPRKDYEMRSTYVRSGG